MKITMSAAEAAKIILTKVVPAAPRPDGDFHLRWVVKDGDVDGVEIDIGERDSLVKKPALAVQP